MNTSGGAMPRRTPGTDNRVLRVCGLLNRHRVRYLLAGGDATRSGACRSRGRRCRRAAGRPVAAVDGRHVADLDLVVYVADDKERLIKESRHKVDLKLKDENYQRYLRDGIPFDVTMRAAQPPKYVKVIVYDYVADLLGSAIVKLK
jgi:hypothetical protein